MDTRSIGVFDSGVGGLTVVKEIKKLLPNESIVYLGDTARIPYGTRSKQVVTRFALEDAKFLERKNVKCIVIACNTASAQSFKEVKRSVSVPVLDVVSAGVRGAVDVSKNKKIGVIATRGTSASRAYKRGISRKHKGIRTYEVACPLLVPIIEEGEIGGVLVNELLSRYLQPLINEKIDTLVLGCTHYPLLKKPIRKYIGDNVFIVDSGVEVAKDLAFLLDKQKLSTSSGTVPTYEYFVTDLGQNFIEIAEWILEEEVGDSVQVVGL